LKMCTGLGMHRARSALRQGFSFIVKVDPDRVATLIRFNVLSNHPLLSKFNQGLSGIFALRIDRVLLCSLNSISGKKCLRTDTLCS
jgi:hypothetical protein